MHERKREPYRLVVFDWDGTLRDSIASIVGCAHASLADIGLETTDDAIRSTVGLSLDESIGRWAGGISRSDVDVVMERYRHHWIERFHAEGSLFEGVEEVLVELSGNGHMLAVATGKSRAGLDRDFAQFGSTSRRLEGLFVASRTADETAAKPSPQMLLELMGELGARPEETLMIGDTTHDLLMAQNAGVDALGVLGGAMGSDLLAPLALDVLAGVGDLARWLEARLRVR